MKKIILSIFISSLIIAVLIVKQTTYQHKQEYKKLLKTHQSLKIQNQLLIARHAVLHNASRVHYLSDKYLTWESPKSKQFYQK